MKIKELFIQTKSELIEFPFSEAFTYIYGKMGAGKTTVVKLISFCFGEDLIDTPALQQEFLSAKLHVVLGTNDVYLTRASHDKKVSVEWKSIGTQDVCKYVKVPITPDKGTSVLPDVHIENLSDMLFYLMDNTPPKVRQNKTSEESDLKRLSFKNIMCFWNLDQDSIDSSFFYLEEKSSFQKNSSKDVMRMILGYYYEKIAELENELSSIQAKKRGLIETIKQLNEFLKEHEIDNLGEIDSKLSMIEEEIVKQESNRKKSLKYIVNEKPHITDDLRHQIYKYSKDITVIEIALKNLVKQIELQKQLQEEYFYSSIKSKNLQVARDILRDVEFQKCPACGKDIIKKIDMVCCLCNQSTDTKLLDNYTQMEIDLLERRNDISNIIEKMQQQKEVLLKQYKVLLDRKKELDITLTKEEKDYDSLYLSNIKQLDNTIQVLQSDKRYWNKIRVLPLKIDSLNKDLGKIQVEEDLKKDEILLAKEESDRQENQLENLKSLFLDTLINVNFPSIQSSDSVLMTTKDFNPKIITKDNDVFEVDFIKLSSGGKKTIFKACFAIALQRLVISLGSTNIPFPNILIIDTPMKNISERENSDIFEGFYKYIYIIMQTELKDMQLIIIDKEFYPPSYNCKVDMISKHMTNDNPEFPGLLPYYKGH